MMNKLIEVIEEKLDNDSLDEYGDYVIDKLLFGELKEYVSKKITTTVWEEK